MSTAIDPTEAREAVDPNQPYEIAKGIWWVGGKIDNDPFQCHTYLIDNGDESVLIDPGSLLTFEETFRKIEQVIGFSKIRYFVCHHQDPDITSALLPMCERLSRDDAMIVTHWRCQTLLKHLALPLEYWLVEEHGWQLELADRTLDFIFTPYMHFPGAFCTFDRVSKILFSSDIFGGFTDGWRLYASDESCFEGMRPFHEHYIPSREIMAYTLAKLEQYPIELIAPQHGCLIQRHLIPFIFDKLRELDCGLYLLSRGYTDVLRLSNLNRRLRSVMNAMVLYREFRDVIRILLELVRSLLPVSSLEFFALWGEEQALYLGPRNRYRGVRVKVPPFCRDLLGEPSPSNVLLRDVEAHDDVDLGAKDTTDVDPMRRVILLPLCEPGRGTVDALCVVTLEGSSSLPPDAVYALEEMRVPLQVAIDRERILRQLESDRQSYYEASIRDPLTGLYTRVYLNECAGRFLDLNDRDPNSPVAVVMLDLDHFKAINDTFGHGAGDQVLRHVGGVLNENVRDADVPTRYGGEEFLILLVGRSARHALRVAERIRVQVEGMRFDSLSKSLRVSISAGVALREERESLPSLLTRADSALYRAKRTGRNRVCVDGEALDAHWFA
ncbi:MAG: diguanylate cyclase [Deltaproteobacteria bacterium]|nr:diguanylate cyclase [Deltaproteobacteria bacterium]